MNNWTCPHTRPETALQSAQGQVPCYERAEIIPGLGEAGPYSICPITQTHCFSKDQMNLRSKFPDLDPPATPNRVVLHDRRG